MESPINNNSNGPVSLVHAPHEKFVDGADRNRGYFHSARSFFASAWSSFGM
jgi:hypothetical protein